MSSSTSLFLLLLTLTHLLLHVNPNPCPPQKFTCGKKTLAIKFPFFTPKSSNECLGFHYIQCMNLVPTVHFNGSGYFYPVAGISYHDRAIIIHDLNLSAYFRGSDCVFLYDFVSPVPGFPFSSGESLFGCRQDHGFRSERNLSLCRDYSLFYSTDYGKRDPAALPGYCSKSRDLWFHWKLSFGGSRDGGETSLLAAGFSPEWVNHQECFSCEFAPSGNCSGAAGDRSCRCSSSCQGKKKKMTEMGAIIGVSAAAAGVFLVSILCVIYYWRHFRRRQNQQRSPSSISLSYYSSITGAVFSDKAPDISGHPYQNIHIFTCEELCEVTNFFDAAMEIGGGGFGIVYKGTLRDGRPVAVKRLYEKTYRRAEQFLNEVVILSRLHHENLVSLYGCTSPRSRELLLVYELVPNGTVADHLHGTRAAEGRLTWPRRLSVAVETAAALTYLHSVSPPIVHRDIKTGNILLDADFHVKVADFGLSRLFPGDGATHISSAPQGTPGYLDPEYHRSYQLTDRSDVYSFGVVLAELLSSKTAVDLSRERAEINLSALAVNKIQSGNLDELVDRKMMYNSGAETRRTVRLVAELAFRCLQADREMRPAIKEVFEVLRGLQSGVFWGSEKARHCAEQVVGGAGVEKGGEARPISPDSVTDRWMSRSATPNSSVDQQ